MLLSAYALDRLTLWLCFDSHVPPQLSKALRLYPSCFDSKKINIVSKWVSEVRMRCLAQHKAHACTVISCGCACCL